MTTLSAGQLMQSGEVQALAQVCMQAQGPAIAGGAPLALSKAAASGALDPTNTTMAGASIAEYGATGYTRQAFGSGAPSAASPSVASNASTITYGPFTASVTGTIVWGILTQGTGSSALAIAAFLLGTARTPLTGDSLQAAAAAFTCQL
jgi:hypothetical protein